MINGKKVLEHRLVWIINNGLSEIPDKMVIHHIDENKLNNDINNLCLLSNSDHSKLHWNMRKQEVKI